MSTRTIVLIATVATCLLPSLARAADASGQRPPNILIILSDDHSAAHVGCYGDKTIRTPNLDSLASEGTRFTRAFATSPQCSPNRGSILTGQFAHQTNNSRLGSPLSPDYPNVVDLLEQA